MLNYTSLIGLMVGITAPVITSSDHRDCHDTRKATPISQEQLMTVMHDAYVKLFNVEPSKNRLLVGWAQVAFENGGGKTILNNNFGNVGPRVGEECFYCRSDGHFYRSYTTPIEGAIRYWEVVSRCRSAWGAFDRGYVVSAMHALKRCNYFEMDLDTYTHRVAVIYDYITKKVKIKENNERERRQQELESYELAERPEQSSVGRCDR